MDTTKNKTKNQNHTMHTTPSAPGRAIYDRMSGMGDNRSARCLSRMTARLALALTLVLVLGGVLVPAQPSEAQTERTVRERTAGEPLSEPTWVPLVVISAEIQRLPREMRIVANERAETVRDALLLKMAVPRRDLDRFTPATQPQLFLGRQVFPILRQESSNWDLQEETPLDPSAPVGEIEYFYFLVPRWQELPEAAVPILAVRRPNQNQLPSVSEIESRGLRDEALQGIEGSVVFRRSMIVDRR